MSGDVDVELEDDGKHGLMARSISGDTDIDGWEDRPAKHHKRGVEVEGGPYLISVSSASGDVNIAQA